MRHLYFKVTAGALLLLACSGPQQEATRQSPGDPPQMEAWQKALFPLQIDTGLWAERWGRHIALRAGGRIYGSNGQDAPTNVAAALYPLVLRDQPYQGRSWALIGIGSGIELGAILATSPAKVDLFEPHPRPIQRTGELLIGRLGEKTLPIDRLSQAEAFSGINGLRFEEGRPVHDRLRILRTPPSERPSYDIIVHAVGLSVLSEPYRLYCIDRFAALKSMLSPGGRLVVHLQLYEIDPDVLMNLMRTFAETFAHVTAMAPEDLSSDVLLIGSDEDLAVHLPRASAMADDPALALWLERITIDRPTDFASRALWADRGEVSEYTGDGLVYSTARPMGREELPRRYPTPPFDIDNLQYDRLQIQFRQEQGFNDGFVSTFYSPDWPFGDPCPQPPACRFLRSMGSGDRLSAELAQLMVSSGAHGRGQQARNLLTWATSNVPSPSLSQAQLAIDALNLPFPPTLDLDALVWQSPLRARFDDIARLIDGDRLDAAQDALRELSGDGDTPADLAPVVTLFEAVLARSPYQYRQSIEALEELARSNEGFVQEHPVVWLLITMLHRQDYDYRQAALAAERYAELTHANTEVSP